MAITFEALAGKLTLDVSQWVGGFGSAGQALGRFVAQAKPGIDQIKRGYGQLIQAGSQVARNAGAVVVAAGGVSAALVKLASDAEETASKFGFVFKEATDSTGKALDEFAAKAGRSRYFLRNMAADIGALIGPMGFSADETGKLSTQFAKLAVDLSSFFNVSENDALTALRPASWARANRSAAWASSSMK